MRHDGIMRLVTFETTTERGPVLRLGALAPVGGVETVVDLQLACLAHLTASRGSTEASRIAETNVPSVMERFIAGGAESLAAAASALDFAREMTPDQTAGPAGRTIAHSPGAVRLLPPLAPNSLRDFVAFEDHARAGATRRGEDLQPTWFERPIYYKGNHRSLLGPGEPLRRPAFTKELDFELEVACIVAADIIDASDEAAAAAIFGYTIMNDWSARDIQRAEMASRLGPAKSKDFATSIGPCILTADEAGPNPAFKMTARVNDKVLCEANLAKAHWTFPKMISFVSQGELVHATDLYGSGTPFGGCMLDHDGPYLEPGDVVELEVEGLGVLRSEVVA